MLAMQMQIPPKKKERSSANNSETTEYKVVQGFKQQMLKAWLPIPTLTKTIILFCTVSIIFLAIGIPMTVLSNNIIEVTVDNYGQNQNCTTSPINCSIGFTISTAMSGPVFVYYQLNNYYQNHRLYTSSINYNQLTGKSQLLSKLQSTCFPIVNNSHLYTNVSITGASLAPNETANPCGIVPYTIFNDTFNINYPNKTNVSMTTDGIAWPSDVARFVAYNQSTAWLNISDPRFMNWIRISTLPNFRKLWARIDSDLPAGNYTLFVNNSYTVSQFGAKKSFVLSTSNFFGSKNQFLSIIYLVMGCICFIIATAFLVKKCRKDRLKAKNSQ